MPAKPWKLVAHASADKEYLALLSYLPLRSYGSVLPFIYYTMQIIKQIDSAPGSVGYSLLARPMEKKFWTLSAWETEDALQAFVQQPPHMRIMVALSPHMKKTDFLRWAVRGSKLPLNWDDALARFRVAGH